MKRPGIIAAFLAALGGGKMPAEPRRREPVWVGRKRGRSTRRRPVWFPRETKDGKVTAPAGYAFDRRGDLRNLKRLERAA